MLIQYRILFFVALAPVCESNHWVHDHNVYRCMHGMPAVRWSTKLGNDAIRWSRNPSSQIVWAGSHDKNRGFNIGENLAWTAGGSITTNGFSRSSPTSWYNEIKFWQNGSWNPRRGFFKDVGHMTQMLWRSTKEIGCHTHRIVNGRWDYVAVCRYRPAGNSARAFRKELPATYRPVKSRATCEAEMRGGQGPSTQRCMCSGVRNNKGLGGSCTRSSIGMWCYVTSNSSCRDKRGSPTRPYSYEACAGCMCSGVKNNQGLGGSCTRGSKGMWCYVTSSSSCRDKRGSTTRQYSYEACAGSGGANTGVSCGSHRAARCEECPRGNGATWCNGQCRWVGHTCKSASIVSCGGHYEASCAECPRGHGANWCHGDCRWSRNTCISRFSGGRLLEDIDSTDDARPTQDELERSDSATEISDIVAYRIAIAGCVAIVCAIAWCAVLYSRRKNIVIARYQADSQE